MSISRMSFQRWLLIMIALLAFTCLFGDKVVLQNGNEMIGTIVSSEGDSVIIRDINNRIYRVLKVEINQIEMSITLSGGPSQQPAVAYDTSDNNSFSKANFLKMDSGDFLSFDASISEPRDRDYYYFIVEKAGYYKIKVTAKDTSYRPGVRVINANNATMINWAWAEIGKPEIETGFDQGYLNLGDKVYFEVAHYGDKDPMDYHLQLSVDFLLDAYESNNRFKEAKSISENSDLRDFIFPRADHDFYKITIPQAGRLLVDYSHEDVNMRPALRLVSGENTTLMNWLVAKDVGQMVQQTCDFAGADEVYLELMNYADSRRSLLTYWLKTQFIPIPDAYEPNNRYKEAKPIPVGQRITAYLFPIRDQDWYYFTVDQPGIVDIQIASDDPLVRPAFRVCSAENTTIHNWVSAQENTSEAQLSIELLPDIYYLEIGQYGNNHASLMDYRLQLNLTPAIDPLEPNGSFALARQIGLDSPINAMIFPKGDGDFYKLLIDKPCELVIQLKSDASLKMTVRIINANNTTFYNWQTAKDPGQDLNFTATIKEPGWYFLEIRNHYDSGGSAMPYQLLLTSR